MAARYRAAICMQCCFTASNASMSLGLRYYGGIIDIMKNIPSGQYNRALSLNICVPIGVAGKVQ